MDELNNGDQPTRRGRPATPPTTTSGHHPIPGRTRQSALSKVQSHFYVHFSLAELLWGSNARQRLLTTVFTYRLNAGQDNDGQSLCNARMCMCTAAGKVIALLGDRL